MQNLYTLIDNCLLALRQCDIPAMPKLRLEVQIFQVKLLLLRDDVSRDIRKKYCTETVLQQIQQQLTVLDDTEGREFSLEAVGLDLQRIAYDLSEAVTKAHSGPGNQN